MMRSNQLSYAPGMMGIIAEAFIFCKPQIIYGGGRKFQGLTL